MLKEFARKKITARFFRSIWDFDFKKKEFYYSKYIKSSFEKLTKNSCLLALITTISSQRKFSSFLDNLLQI